MIYCPVFARPDWLKALRNAAQYLLYLARRALFVRKTQETTLPLYSGRLLALYRSTFAALIRCFCHRSGARQNR
jgi:hypothetical protein